MAAGSRNCNCFDAAPTTTAARLAVPGSQGPSHAPATAGAIDIAG
jgi:hypothetical protein